MVDIRNWSETAANNATTPTINWAEGMPPSDVNNSARAMMADVRGQFDDGGWFNYGDTHAYSSGTATNVASDASARYEVNRRIRAQGTVTGTIYGSVSAVTFSSQTTISYLWDSGSLSNETLSIAMSYIAVTGKPLQANMVAGLTNFAGGTLSSTLVMAAPLIMQSSYISEAKGAAISVTTTMSIWIADGNYLHIVGTGNVDRFGTAPQAGDTRTIVFDGAVSLSHNATSLILPGGVNITTAAGDVAVVRAETTANHRVVDFQRASGAPLAGGMISGTSQATTSGSSFDFAIPTTAKFITVLLNSSLSGTDGLLVQIGTGGTPDTTGYSSASAIGGVVGTGSASGFVIHGGVAAATMIAVMTLGLQTSSSNTWIEGHSGYRTDAPTNVLSGAGSKSLSGPINILRLTTTGADTFDAGAVNVLYS